MAASLGNFFDGAQTVDATSAQQAITAGDYVLAVQGVFDGARLVVIGDVFGGDFVNLEGGLSVDRAGFVAFRFCDANLKVRLEGAGPGTSVTCGVLPAQ